MTQFGTTFGSDPSLSDDQILEATEPSIFRKGLQAVTTPISTILDTLDIPGSLTRGVLSGRGFQRTSGKEFLEELGLLPDEGFGRSLASFLAEVVVDPLIFTGSVVGLTKAGKVAQRVEKLNKESQNLKAIFKETGKASRLGREAKRRVIDQLKQNRDAVKDLTGKHINDLTAEDFLGLTRLEQVERGQRGATAAIPFGRELGKIPFFNKTFAKLGDSIAATSIFPEGAVKALKKRFSTASDSPIGDFQNVQAQRELGEAGVRSGALLRNNIDEFELEAKNMVKTAALGNSPITLKEAKSKISEDITQVAEAIGSPEKHRKLENDLIKAKENRLQTKANEIDAETRELLKADPRNTDSIIAGQTKKFRGVMASINKDYNTKIFDAEKKRVELQLVLDTIGTDGSFPRRVAESFRAAQIDLLDYEKDAGIAIEALDDLLGFVPHILSQEGKALFKSNKKFRKFVGGDVIGSIPSHSRKRKIRGKTIQDLNIEMEKEFGIKNAYTQDIFAIFKQKEIATQLAVNKARNVQMAVSLYSRTKLSRNELIAEAAKLGDNLEEERLRLTLAAEEDELVEIADVMAANGMNKIVLDGNEIGVSVALAHKERAAAIRDEFLNLRQGTPSLPKTVAQDLINIHKITNENINIPLAMFDTINQIFRTYVTSFIPAHIGTNTIGNTLMNLISVGPVATIKHTRRAAAVLAEAKSKHFKEIFTNAGGVDDLARRELDNFISGGAAGTRMDELLVAEGKLIRIGDKNVDAAIKLITDNRLTRGGFAVNGFSEETAKLAHFMAQREAGMTVNEAIFSAKKYLFDYQDITDFERKYMRRLVLFYTFARKNLPLMVSETIANRKAYLLGKTSTATLATEEFIPEYVKETGNVAVGDDTFVDIRNPVFEPNKFGTQGGGIGRFLERVGGQLGPALKLPLEVISGREFFRGKPLGELNRLPDTVFGIPAEQLPGTTTFTDRSGVTQTVGDPAVLELIRNLPTARVQQTVADFLDPDISFFSGLGPRGRVLDEELRRNKILQERLTASLKGDPTVASFKRFFPLSSDPSQRTRDILSSLTEKSKEFKALIGGGT